MSTGEQCDIALLGGSQHQVKIHSFDVKTVNRHVTAVNNHFGRCHQPSDPAEILGPLADEEVANERSPQTKAHFYLGDLGDSLEHSRVLDSVTADRSYAGDGGQNTSGKPLITVTEDGFYMVDP